MVLDKFRLDGQVAVVTGASKGIGRGIAIALAEAGADVVLASRTFDALEETRAAIEAAGRRAVSVAADVSTFAAHDQIADQALQTFGKLSIWVSNAGGLPDATPRWLAKTSEEQWDAQIDLNLKSVWAGAVAASKRMKESGAIINISSRASYGGHIKNGPYSAAKAAVNSLTATQAIEMGPAIRVNAVAPGPIATQNVLESMRMRPDQAGKLEELFPVTMKRLGQPEDIGAAVVFLASPAASWITGQCLYVTGGM